MLAIATVSAPDIRITNVQADSNFLFPKSAKRLTKFMMDETFGVFPAFSAGWAQRGVFEATAQSDFFGRLEYYQEARDRDQRCGSILVAETPNGDICGFADVGASLWLPNDKAFRLPQDPDLRKLATTGLGADGQPKPGVQLRPYVSNVVVDESLRRCGIGRKLMAACEADAESWLDSCSTAGSYECDSIWLEVTTTNTEAIAFYESLGYREAEGTQGTEVQPQGDGFTMQQVERLVMRKAIL